MGEVTRVGDLLEGRVVLDLECLDRIYLNGYIANLQTSGGVASFMTAHLKKPIPSPAIMHQIGKRFRAAVESFSNDAVSPVPMVRFAKGDRKQDVMAPFLARQAATGVSGVAAIGVAQEFQNVFTGHKSSSSGPGGTGAWFSFSRCDRRVTCYYFYVWDEDFGPGFIKICAYFPYPVKVWLNGHEWAKRQATRAGIAFTELSNGFATCEDPAGLQAICDRLGPADIEAFFDRWMCQIPAPMSLTDRGAGYWWELSMRQVEISRTVVFDAPRHARRFFEALVVDNLDIGRPESVQVIFADGRRGAAPKPPREGYATKIDTRQTTGVSVNAFFKNSRIKQYLKDGRALRIETVVNKPDDLGCRRRLVHLDDLQAKGRAVNARLLDTERVGQGCVLASPAFERVAQSTVTDDGRRSPALRFGDPRVMALLGALCVALNSLGFTNKRLRAQVTQLLGVPDDHYTATQMSYDLVRLRRKGLIQRRPGSHVYDLTPDGIRVAIFYTKVHDRLLGPLIAADAPPAPPEIRRALSLIERHVQTRIEHARLGTAA